METVQIRQISIAAFYLSKFDKQAWRTLGYNTQIEALRDLSKIFGKIP